MIINKTFAQLLLRILPKLTYDYDEYKNLLMMINFLVFLCPPAIRRDLSLLLLLPECFPLPYPVSTSSFWFNFHYA